MNPLSTLKQLTNGRATTLAVLVVTAALLITTQVSHAADALNGKTLYSAIPPSGGATCASCHGSNPATNTNKILKGANNAALITSAISANTGGMRVLLNKWTANDIADMAAYLGNLNVTGAAIASLTPIALSYPSTIQGTSSSTQIATLSNAGNAALNLSGISVSGTHPGDFTWLGSAGCAAGSSLAAGASCTLTVGFTPQGLGFRSATLAIAHSVGTSNISLSGTGAAAPSASISLNQNLLAFGSVTQGSTSSPLSVQVSNSGSANLELSGINLSGAQSAMFSTAGSCTVGTSLPPAASCNIDARFSPSAVIAANAKLNIVSNASNGIVALSLQGSGTAIPVPLLIASPVSLAFGAVTTSSSSTQTISWQNTGTATAALGVPNIIGSGFSLVNANVCASSLAAGASCALQVKFTPTAATTYSGSLQLPGSNALTIQLDGSGSALPTPLPTLAPANALSFSDTTVGQSSSTSSFTIGNNGTAGFTISQLTVVGANAADFAISGSCAVNSSIAAGASCSGLVKFAPTAVGLRQARLQLTNNGGTVLGIDLTGTGKAVATSSAALSAGTVVFADTNIGSTSPTQTLFLNNNGNQAITINSIMVPSSFSLQTDPTGITSCASTPFVLNPGLQCALPLNFKPSAAGSDSGILGVSTSVAGLSIQANLSGKGLSSSSNSSGTTTVTTDPSGPSGGAASGSASTSAGSATGASTSLAAPTNLGSGGCSTQHEGNDITLVLVIFAAIFFLNFRESTRMKHLMTRIAASIIISLGIVGNSHALELGNKAPDFAVSDGKSKLTLADFKGKYLYVDFWASWCGPCRQSFPWMNAMHEKHAGKGLHILGINVDAKPEDARKFLEQVPAKFSLAYDPAGTSPRTYGVKGMPTSYLIGPDGTVLMIHASFKESDKAEMEAKILKAMGNK